MAELTDSEKLDKLWKWMKKCKKQMAIVQDRLRIVEQSDDDNSN